jgi:hypothetical protein
MYQKLKQYVERQGIAVDCNDCISLTVNIDGDYWDVTLCCNDSSSKVIVCQARRMKQEAIGTPTYVVTDEYPNDEIKLRLIKNIIEKSRIMSNEDGVDRTDVLFVEQSEAEIIKNLFVLFIDNSLDMCSIKF